ncbi:MAG: RHS repeat-associated core domain-containing protein, partial [Verrucomicrobiota bacterium]
TKSGGDENGANLRSATYTANGLNQYTSRGVPGYVDVLGLALATNTVTVNGTAAYRKGEYFRNERSVNNSSTALWTNIIVAAAGETSVTGNVFVAQSPEAFGYDLDGNLTNDGRWAFTWDAENRLTQIESLTNGPTASKRRVTWQYDSQGRRQRQTTYDLSSGSAVVTEDLKFVNDGWRCLAELNGTNNALVRRYTWGLELSGSMDGAGGVGGLLWLKADSDPQFCAYDGNGNVAGLVRGSTGDQTAAYEYDPFGRTIRMTGVFAQSNPFRFSTKRANDTTDLVLYEYRAYNPSSGRWLSRDPIEERGGLNLYGFDDNNPINEVDFQGLDANAFFPDAWQNGLDAAGHRLSIYLILEAAAFASDFRGRPMTSKFLFHYLAASGREIALTESEIKEIRGEPGFKKDELANIGKILRSAGAGKIDYKDSSYQDHFFDPDVNPVDLFSAFHGIHFKNGLNGCVTKSGMTTRFQGELTIELFDNWNFSDPGPKSKRTPFATVPGLPKKIKNITEEEFRQLELHEYVKPFDIKGNKTSKVTIEDNGAQLPVIKSVSTY